MTRHSFTSDSAHRALGVAGVVGLVALALCSDADVLTRFHVMNTAKAEDSLIAYSNPSVHAGACSGFPRASTWHRWVR